MTERDKKNNGILNLIQPEKMDSAQWQIVPSSSPLTPEELEQLMPGTLERERQFDKLVREIRAIGPFFFERSKLPEDLR